ncbi:hypothetical protein vseg_001934 [Gypsophila vaccaria]
MKGVDKALEKEFRIATRRICAQHLYTNFKDKWSGPMYHELYWRAANATSAHAYNKAMEQMIRLAPSAVQYLSNVTQQWSKYQFQLNVACHHNTSNFVESFNALINDLREKPIFSLMEGIRLYYMDKFAERMEVAESIEPTDLTPYAKGLLELKCSESRSCKVIRVGGGEFEVHEGVHYFPVDIVKGTCLCGEWQVTGIPCKHACRAIYHNKEEPLHYVHGFFSGSCYKLTYVDQMHPLPDKEAWPIFDFPEVLPPLQERGVGRPARQRRRKPDEPKKGKRSSTLKCSICNTFGHNARSCQGGPTAKQKKAAAGIGQKKSVGAGQNRAGRQNRGGNDTVDGLNKATGCGQNMAAQKRGDDGPTSVAHNKKGTTGEASFSKG